MEVVEMLEQVKIILEWVNSIEEEMNEFKLSVHNDNMSKHRIHIEADDIIIELYTDDKISSPKDLYYGKVRGNKAYIGRWQHISSIEYDPIDVYDEFFSTGTELKFN
jgi:hypothetical protein